MRFIFAIFVVNGHLFGKYDIGQFSDIYGNFITHTRLGYIAVDYFFMIAGFFLLFTFKDMPVIDFIKKKICRFWPLMCFLFILYLLLSFTDAIKIEWSANFISLFFLENIGILTVKKSSLGITWFLSSLMFSSIFYYYLFKHYKRDNVNLVVCILTFFVYIFCFQASGGAIKSRFDTFNYFFNIGFMRAIAGMGFGIIIYNIYEYFKKQKFIKTTTNFISMTLLEGVLLFFVLYNTGFHRYAFKDKICLLLGFASLFLLFLLKRGFFSKILNNKKLATLGNYALSIYLLHPFVLLIYNLFVYKQYAAYIYAHPYIVLASVYILVGIISVIAHRFVEKPCAKLLSKKLFPEKTKI